MKKIVCGLVSILMIFTLFGCSGQNDKLFEDDIKSFFTEIQKPDSEFEKQMDEAISSQLNYMSFTGNDKEKIHDGIEVFCKNILKGAKYNSMKVEYEKDKANVTANISINDIDKMSTDFAACAEKIKEDLSSKKTPEEIAKYFEVKNVKELTNEKLVSLVVLKSLDNFNSKYTDKSYQKTMDMKIVYQKTGNEWNITKESEQQFLNLFIPQSK